MPNSVRRKTLAIERVHLQHTLDRWTPTAAGNGPRKNRPRHGSSGNPSFKAGDIVRQSGIYEVIHDAQHRTAHEVVMIKGDAFPTCETCMDRVRFRLVRTAPYIFQDEDFGES